MEKDEESGSGERIRAGTHPSDRLPEYARGTASDPESVEAHLAACPRCREEVELLRALAAPGPFLDPEERERLWSRVAAGGAVAVGRRPASPRGGFAWRAAAWRIAAAVALVAMGFGVWRVNQQAAGGGDWNPTAAMRGWEEDLEALRPAPEDVRLALGYEAEGTGVPWEALDLRDPAGLPVPWSEDP